MQQVRYDVIVVGAGPGGVTAAATAARAGASVLLLEAGVFAGAENWSGCVYFTESLLDADAFGPDAITGAPFERRVVRRGIAMTDGETLVGASHHDKATFEHCYTVLRPAFDPYWAERARALGATVQANTTVTSLIRRNGRVVGVHTNHGPAYGDITFLAEGDASHLVRYEGLERVEKPGLTQGVKAVYRLNPDLIEQRFGLRPGEGAANEVLIRKPGFGGRDMNLNIAAFIYTNRDSLSVGYAVPLEQMADGFRGKHEDLLAHVCAQPGIAEYMEGAELSAFGTKLIRTGGIRRAPRRVEDGLVVGGSAAALGIDAPYPNFTGPAAATGLYFGRAVTAMAATGQAPTADNLAAAYLEPLQSSRYWQDAETLKAWPDFLESSKAAFGTGIDLTCGTARYLTDAAPVWTRLWNTGRLLRGHLAPKRLSALMAEDVAAGAALGATPHLKKALSMGQLGRMLGNSFSIPEGSPDTLTVTIRVNGEERSIKRIPWGIRGPIRHQLAGLGKALGSIYQNGPRPFAERMAESVRAITSRLRLFDLLLVGLTTAGLGLVALATALYDLFRFKLLKVPAAEVLDNRVARDQARLKTGRDLEGRPDTGAMAARLATNTYLEGDTSHIRVLWPDALQRHSDLADSPYWSVCPAGVYAFEPVFVGHGQVTVNFENCVKCESCWQSDDGGVRWGRHTDHRLIYRPDTAALDIKPLDGPTAAPHRPTFMPAILLPENIRDKKAHQQALAALSTQRQRAENALVAFDVAVRNLPPAADAARIDWARKVGAAARHRLRTLEAALSDQAVSRIPAAAGLPSSPFAPLIDELEEEVTRFSAHLDQNDLFEAVTAARRVREIVLTPLAVTLLEPVPAPDHTVSAPDPVAPRPVEAVLRQRYDDQTIKRWDTEGLNEDDAAQLCAQIDPLPTPTPEHPLPEPTVEAIRAWASLHSGVALLVLHRVAGRALGVAAAALSDGDGLTFSKNDGQLSVSGTVHLVPGRLAGNLVVIADGHARTIDINGEGAERRTNRAGGMHPARFESIRLDNASVADAPLPDHLAAFLAHGYGAIALGAGDYLARRAVEQAAGRIQFPGQMIDSVGNDSIAKFGAVKALVSRTLAWRELLDATLQQPDGGLLAALAQMAFSPKDGRMAYDAGQVFGGTGYSEDEQMSRCYRDSAVFRHLTPGRRALADFAERWQSKRTPLAARLVNDDTTFSDLSGGALSDHLAQWQDGAARIDALDIASEPAREALALAVGCYHLLVRVAARLGRGIPVEGEAAALETLLRMLADLIAKAQAEQANGGVPALAHFPEMPECDPQPLAVSYAEIVQQGDTYASGDFLRKAPGEHPQFVPEIQLHDPALRDTWNHTYQWFLDHCRIAPDDGGPYEHYVERTHTIPAEMLVGFRQSNFFASVVPSELDGLGWKKIGYYLLVSGAMRFGDASLSLLIMASTSIGTTPALIARDKEIPLVEKELNGFKNDPDRLGKIATALDGVVAQLAQPDPKKLERDVAALVAMVDGTIRKTKVVKYLAQNFLMTFYGAAMAGRRKDFAAFSKGMVAAQQRLKGLPQTIDAALAELPLRKKATDRFLTALGHGAVAAFALTEPTAGSDSGGVTTVGHLKTAQLEPLGDGRYRFEVDGEPRYLLDADRIRYGTPDGAEPDYGTNGPAMYYLLQSGEAAPIRYHDYDYATDTGVRYVHVLGEDLPFHDIAEIRDGNRYEYYQVSGAKMWITNGRVAAQFAMYIKTDEGISGIMVDRHAEGLIVGRDEEKMGQQGSPTNELSIDRMRVPRENIIGYEGHGQVNALDTLNVGRCGLAVAGVVMTRRQLVEAKRQLPASETRDRVLAEVAARVFSNESLVFHLIGRFDNKATESVRLESAIAKYTCSELLHEALDKIEPLWGPHGQTRDLLIEKMRRDARILNIYEGTNEVQRFLILRELCGMVKGWQPQSDAGQPPRWAAMTRWKETLRQAVTEVDATLGDAAWQDTAMQPALFPLAEMAGELYLMDATLYRLKWLEQHAPLLGDDYTGPMIATGERGVTQCLSRLQALYDRYNRGRAAALAGRYPAESIAADAAMADHTMAAPAPAPATGTITCLLRPVAITSPTPRLGASGKLVEKAWRINPADEAALAQALALKSHGKVSVTAVCCGGDTGRALLRDALGAGADRVVLLPIPADAGPAAWGRALAEHPAMDARLLVTGAHCDGLPAPLAAFIAGVAERPLQTVEQLDEGPAEAPSVLAVTATAPRLRPTLAQLARAAAIDIDPIEPIATVESAPPAPVYAIATGQSASHTVARTVAEAAGLIRQYAESARRMAATPYGGEWEKRALRTGDGVWTVAQPHEADAATAFRAARELGDALGLPAFALAVGDEDGIRALAGTARDAGISICFGIDTEGAALSDQGRCTLLASVMESKSVTRVVAPSDWQNAFGTLAANHRAEVLSGLSAVSQDGERIALTQSAYGGALSATTDHGKDASLWLTVADTAPFTGGAPVDGFVLGRPGDRHFTQADMDPHFVKPIPGLKTAEVIVDLGLGAGSAEGIKLGEQLMAALEGLSLAPQMGATRKITQGLGLLPQSRQIGQTGVPVNPKLILCLGISGAPQHTDYIGNRAQLIAFNKDPDAPIMQLQKPGCTVHPIVGDLFETVPELIAALGEDHS